MTTEYIIGRKKIKAQVGMQSLIAPKMQYPVGWGNYFWFREPEAYCVNMWAENLKEACNRFLSDDMIEVNIIHTKMTNRKGHEYDAKYVIVIDERIPSDWIHDAPYFCGVAAMPADILKDIYKDYNWNYDDTLKYIDPVKYYENKPGYTYNPETGSVCVNYEERNKANVRTK